MASLTNEYRTANRTFWYVIVGGKPVARLSKAKSGWNRWSVLKGDRWQQFRTQADAIAWAAS